MICSFYVPVNRALSSASSIGGLRDWPPADSTVLPFVAQSTRVEAAAYQKARGPRAFALTTSGLWLWRGGANVVQAIDKTMADCGAQFKPAPCLLYAVNDRVVFEAR